MAKHIEIKHRTTGAVLYSCEVADDEANPLRECVVRAVADCASLVGASLVGANLVGANLDRARLDGASLVCANLDRARGVTEAMRKRAGEPRKRSTPAILGILRWEAEQATVAAKKMPWLSG